MSRNTNTVKILESRLSCNCAHVKEGLKTTIINKVWKIFFNRFSETYGQRLTVENINKVEGTLKHNLTWELMGFDGHGQTGGFYLIECSINIENPEIDKFPILLHEKSTNLHERLRQRLHENIHFDGKLKIDGEKFTQIIKVSVVVRDYGLLDRDHMEFIDDSSPED